MHQITDLGVGRAVAAAIALGASCAFGQTPRPTAMIDHAQSVQPLEIAPIFSDGSVGQWHPYVVKSNGEQEPAASTVEFSAAETTKLRGPGPEFIPTDGAECGGFDPVCTQSCSQSRRLFQDCSFTYGGIRISATSSINSRGEEGNVGQVFIAWTNKRNPGELDDFSPPRPIGDTVVEVLLYDNWFSDNCGPEEPNLVGGVLVNFGRLDGLCGTDSYYYSTLNLREFEDVCMTIPGPTANFGYEVGFWYDAARSARAANNQAMLWGSKDPREQGQTLDLGYLDLNYDGVFTPPEECVPFQGGGCPGTLAAAVDFWGSSAQGQINLWDNGTFVTHLRQGCNGGDISEIEAPSTTGGFNTLLTAIHQADDFTVPAGQVWQVDVMHWYLFQPNSARNEPIVGAYVRVWDGPPGAGGNVIAGDLVTNRIVGSTFANIFRVTDSDRTNCSRAVKRIDVDMSWLSNLSAGAYWIELGAEGNPGFAGPLSPPTVPRDPATDNSRRLEVATSTWSENLDPGTGDPLDFPFELDGRIISGGGCNVAPYTLTVTGVCPGTVVIGWENAAPRSQQGLVYGARLGSTTIPLNSPCAGTIIGVAGSVRLVTPPGAFNTGSNGSGMLTGQASSGACHGYLVLIEGGSCRTSNIAQVP